MLQQKRLVALPLVGTILLCLLIGVYLMAWKRLSKTTSPVRVVKHTVETPADEALKYWTKDKMRSARPAPMPHLDAPDRAKKRQRRPSRDKSRGDA